MVLFHLIIQKSSISNVTQDLQINGTRGSNLCNFYIHKFFYAKQLSFLFLLQFYYINFSLYTRQTLTSYENSCQNLTWLHFFFSLAKTIFFHRTQERNSLLNNEFLFSKSHDLAHFLYFIASHLRIILNTISFS